MYVYYIYTGIFFLFWEGNVQIASVERSVIAREA